MARGHSRRTVHWPDSSPPVAAFQRTCSAHPPAGGMQGCPGGWLILSITYDRATMVNAPTCAVAYQHESSFKHRRECEAAVEEW
eukprot:scaffold6843_cov149-Isochrysis_galbana.AAC.3